MTTDPVDANTRRADTSSRTIDRRTVHRDHVHEVFVTDVIPDGEWVLAQVPSCHSYFGDNGQKPARFVDFVALLETCRQSAVAAFHEFWRVPADAQFVIAHWRARFPAATRPRYGNGPIDLRARQALGGRREVRGWLSSGKGRVELYGLDAAASLVGTLDYEVSFIRSDTYRLLRSRGRGGVPLVRSAGLALDPATAAPGSVGRQREDNVAIGPISFAAEELGARLRPPLHNPSMFDHSQDHVPAMVLIEAARQLAVAACAGSEEDDLGLVELSSDFHRYVELDSPAFLRSVARPNEEPRDSRRREREFDVVVEQFGQSSATLQLAFDSFPGGTS